MELIIVLFPVSLWSPCHFGGVKTKQQSPWYLLRGPVNSLPNNPFQGTQKIQIVGSIPLPFGTVYALQVHVQPRVWLCVPRSLKIKDQCQRSFSLQLCLLNKLCAQIWRSEDKRDCSLLLLHGFQRLIQGAYQNVPYPLSYLTALPSLFWETRALNAYEAQGLARLDAGQEFQESDCLGTQHWGYRSITPSS